VVGGEPLPGAVSGPPPASAPAATSTSASAWACAVIAALRGRRDFDARLFEQFLALPDLKQQHFVAGVDRITEHSALTSLVRPMRTLRGTNCSPVRTKT